jgi:hypothetical protein
MEYKHYSCDLDSNAFAFLSIYIITSPYTYYAAESEHKILNFILLFAFGILFTALHDSEYNKKIRSAIYIFNICKEDNEKYKKKLYDIQEKYYELADAICERKSSNELKGILNKHLKSPAD